MAFIPKYDEYAANVSLLLPFDLDLTDYSTTPKAVTSVGNAAVSATQKKFGAKSCYFDGTGDYLSLISSSGFGFGTGDFTVEVWLYPTSVTGSDKGIIDLRTGSVEPLSGFTLFLDSTQGFRLAVWDNTAKFGAVGNPPAANQWSHVAVTRSGGTLRGFINGTQQWSLAHTKDLAAANVAGVGGSAADTMLGSSPYAGYMDEIRITKGIARYTADFTVPATFFQIEDIIPLTASSLQMFAPPSPWMDNVPGMFVTPDLFVPTEECRDAIPFMDNPAQVFLPKVASPWQDFIPMQSTAPQVFGPTNYRPPVLSAGSSPVWTRTANNPRFIKTEV